MKFYMKVIKEVIIVILIGVASVVLLLIGNGNKIYKEALKQMSLEEKITTIRQKPNYTKIEDMPQIYKDAVISVEDHRFYSHRGIDLIAIGRAVIHDIEAMSFVEGGSTITQQLAKNMYFTQEKKMTRKIAEVFMAFKIENTCSKDEILELYLNTSYFGNGYTTVKEASNVFFNKEPNEMTDYESILLAGIPNAPSVYNPVNNQDLATKRQKQVIDRMIECKKLTNEQAEAILKSNEY